MSEANSDSFGELLFHCFLSLDAVLAEHSAMQGSAVQEKKVAGKIAGFAENNENCEAWSKLPT